MRSPGDLVTVLSLEDFEFRTGLRQSAQETKQFATDVTKSGNSAAAGMGRAVGQMGFALQDFSSVLSMGGKNALGRALMSTMNNVQMLGMAFGPWGMAITAVGGALGATLLPKLLEGETAFEQIASATAEATSRLEDYISHGKEMIRFQSELANLEGPGQVKTKRDALETRQKEMELEGEQFTKQAGNIRRQMAELQKIADETAPKDGIMKWLFSPAKSGVRALELDPAIEALNKQLEAVTKKSIEAGRALNQIGKQKEMLKDVEPTVSGNEISKFDLELQEKDNARLQAIRDHSSNPAMKRAKLGLDLQDLMDVGKRNPNMAGLASQGMEDLFTQFAASSHQTRGSRLSPAALRGSSEAISAINRASQGATMDPQKQELLEVRKLVDLARQQLAEQTRSRQNANAVIPVALNGGGP
jgi:hypothetical protein